MWKAAALLFTGAMCASAEVRIMTLREAVAMAVRQNPDIALARLDDFARVTKSIEVIRLVVDGEHCVAIP